ncbi:ABC transporter ATP-binding protein [Flavihumibacter profundi]|jgi:putative ABC transport system ATP-binding protein|uniref:ABC transporter ATP-binding protein n=1 Tax=Flavihumibacter profundi TaxID=2716883 RepID=UPI0021D45ED2|nr:ABC transporter ATP-binding protein [Flavihumibacter profundi]
MPDILKMENIKREFILGPQVVKALRGISFSVQTGEFVSIMGSSGSGKSTLLNLIGCLDKATEGDYFLDSTNVKSLDKNELAELRNKKIGFVFQSFNLLPRTSALENVELPLLYQKGISRSERKERAMQALEKVKLADRFEHTPNQLSGGQQQRVAIARALVNEPVLVLADEPTGNLDTRTSYEILNLLQELNRDQQKTILLVTHEPDIATFSSRTLILRDGKLLRDFQNITVRSAKEALAAIPVNDDF